MGGADEREERRFCDGHDANPVFHQHRLDVEVVADVAREAVHFPDEQDVNLSLVFLGEINQFQKLRPVRKLGRFPSLDEDFQDFDVF